MATVETNDSAVKPVGSGQRMEKCLLSNEEIDLPEALLQDINVFTQVVSGDTWQKVLTAPQRSNLMKFLPTFPEDDTDKKQETLERLFASQTFKFNIPLRQFHRRLKEGKFSPDIAKYAALIRRARLQEYRHTQKVYYSHLLKEILVSRQHILEQVYQLPPTEDPLKLNPRRYQVVPPRQQRSIEYRVKRKVRKIIKEVNEECGLEDTSSEEEDDRHTSSKGRKQLFKTLPGQESPPEAPTVPLVLATFASKPLMMNGDSGGQPVTPKRGVSPIEITADDFAEMIQKHRKRRADSEDHPDLDTKNLTLDDIILRTHPGKKNLKATGTMTHHGPPGKKKPKEASEKKRRVKIEGETTQGADDESLGREAGSGDTTGPQTYKNAVNFFCLLRDFICERPESRVTTAKLEERVREWQETPSAGLFNDWFREQPQWGELVQSALKFLAGNALGLSLENFVPLLDYKERAQQWKWIGEGRDADAELSMLCQHWLENKDDISLDPTADGASTPPPARSSTTFHVRPTTEEEKTVFREQEQKRFTEPQKAFTYRMHNYESVVGPVKGVYSKGNAMNKAREHALLVSDRPAFVTILTLVRDAAARLPNGEGTRSDICELLKDSQFLAPGVTDAQVNTVVSGALDRLHYEKDPCVKYDVNRKLWIYLHRSRTEDEFEKIHQAQGAAAKARKALQKPKPSKKIKEAMALQQGALGTSPSTPGGDVTFAHPTLSLPTSTPTLESKDTVLNIELPSPGAVISPSPKATTTSPKGSPRAQSSPRGVMKTVVVSGVTPIQNVMKVGGQLSLSALKISMPQKIAQLQGTLLHGQPPSPKATKFQQVPVAYVTSGSPKSGQPQFVGQKPIATQFIQTPQVTGTSKGMSVSFVSQSHGGATSQKGILAPTILAGCESLTPDSKPVAFSLIQSQDGTLRAAQQTPHGVPARTVVLTTATKTDRGGTQKIVATVKPLQQLSHGHLTTTSVVSSPGISPGAQSPAVALTPRMSGKPSIPVGSATSKMAVTRFVQQLGTSPQQVISMATRGVGGAQKQVVRIEGSRTSVQGNTKVKIQGGSMIQTVGETPPVGDKLQIQRTVSVERRDSLPDGTFKSEIPGTQAINKPQVATPGGKPATLIITKPSTPPVVMTSTSVVQLLQSNPAGGRSAMLGGKPIIIGGKPTIFSSGMPMQIGGKPLQVGSKPVQIGGKPMQFAGAPVQIVGKPFQLIGKPRIAGASQAGVVSSLGLVSQTSGMVTLSGASPAPPSLVTQILQSAGTIVQQPRPAVTAVTSSRLGLAGGVRGLTMTRMVNPSQIIVTGLPQGSSVRPGTAAGGQARMVTVSQGSLLGNQIMVQQSPSHTRVITPQQVITGGGGRPTFVPSQGGWPAAGGQLQMLRTVLTQAGSKPGQTTILLAQSSGQSASSLVTSTGQLLQAATVKTVPQSGLKNAPLYARIITPPPGVRLVGMRANQGAVVGQVTSLQNVGMVRAVGKPTEPVSLATSSVVVTSSPVDGAAVTHPEQK